MKAAKIDRSLLQGESFELFSAAIRSPATRDPYERKLLGFLKRINMSPDDFVHFAKDNPPAAEKKVISVLSQDSLKIERGEITDGTVNNWLKAVRLFLEMNDVVVNWKKIRRMLPTIRRYTLDRIPTLDELREIVDADIRVQRSVTVWHHDNVIQYSINIMLGNIESKREKFAQLIQSFFKEPIIFSSSLDYTCTVLPAELDVENSGIVTQTMTSSS